MREEWYADKRDLVKWACLIFLAKEYRASRIIQVPFSYGDIQPWEKCRLFKNASEKVPFPKEVWEHFRNLETINGLARRTGIQIEVFRSKSSWTKETRHQYIQDLHNRLKQLTRTRLIVFLDPDTGIEPQRADLRHVKKCEIKDIFAAMKRRDCLVVYQHKRRTKNWIEDTQKSLAFAINPSDHAVQTLRYKGGSPVFAKDAAFHFVQIP